MPRTRLLSAALLLLVGCSVAQSGRFEDPDFYPAYLEEVSVVVGLRSLTDGAWRPLDGQAELGLVSAWEPPEWPVGLEAGLSGSWDDATVPGPLGPTDVDAVTGEFFLGVRKSLPIAGTPLRPVIGVGASLLGTSFEDFSLGTFTNEDDFAVGAYGKVALLVHLSGVTFVGVEYRRLVGTRVDFGLSQLDTDAHQLHLVFGAAF